MLATPREQLDKKVKIMGQITATVRFLHKAFRLNNDRYYRDKFSPDVQKTMLAFIIGLGCSPQEEPRGTEIP